MFAYEKLFLFAFMLMTVSMGFAQKNVLVEELTGTWCQWCPRGIYYDVTLALNDGTIVTEQTFTINLVEANDTSLVYPTLVKDALHLQTAESGMVKVYSMTGQLMLQQEVKEGSNNMDVSSLSAGVYMVVCNGHVARVAKR